MILSVVLNVEAEPASQLLNTISAGDNYRATEMQLDDDFECVFLCEERAKVGYQVDTFGCVPLVQGVGRLRGKDDAIQIALRRAVLPELRLGSKCEERTARPWPWRSSFYFENDRHSLLVAATAKARRCRIGCKSRNCRVYLNCILCWSP
jgi:hypothetical protein